MNTSLPLLNVITGSQAANGSRSSNPADSFSADVPFNQVLNSQVSNRNSENQSQDKQRAADQPAQPSQPAQSAANGSKPASTDSAQKKQDADKDDDQADDGTATQASAELLALVANLEQNAVKPVTSGKGEDTDADLLAQAKRSGPQLSLKGDDQPLALDGKDKKIDFAALQSSVNAKKEAAPDLAQQQTADAAARAAKSDKPAIDLSADAKTAPKDDAGALSARVQAAKLAPEMTMVKQDAPQATPVPVVMPAMQQALAANQTQAVFGAAYSDKIQPNVGSAGWDQAVGQKVTWMVSGGIQSASLTLNPPDLGPMQVVLSVHNQQADATFITAQPEVKQALEAAMPKLREMMEQAGIQLGQATVNTGMPNQQQNANGQQARGSSSRGTFGKDDEDDVAIAAAGAATVTQSGVGLVDTFV
ncbi:flagellar hook-length control protein FliK [Herbaspirillum robiniae]|uniref:Flagellar hook-length control protein FliK n=1 Tax=Herbaspirillum robiniae TaxID=2014887 RepID=A0ABX2LSI0_9BURK|nr:flagellar hook-length control protein FliK [Herbaspirillum robiniae]NUU00183.1 flagellar hook-length control protein FliK [Herbaspirillum robiniae]